jgi:hypothetical protein
MAKRKIVRRTKRATRRIVHHKAVKNNRLSLLLLALALSVLVLAVVLMSKGGI